MSARLIIFAVVLTPALVQAEKPTEAQCKEHVTEGLANKNLEEARVRFHAARVQCGNQQALIYIAGTFEQQGNLPRALAYIEEFLAVVDRNHEARGAMEQAATVLRQRVPVAQRVSIAAELGKSATAAGTRNDDLQTKLNKQTSGLDDAHYVPPPVAKSTWHQPTKIERNRGLFIGASFAYATMAKVDIRNENMDGTVEFPSVFAAEIQAGYRVLPHLSIALVPQMFFNLQPNQEAAARELELFVQTTGHLRLKPQWDFNLFAAPGYSVLIIPGAGNASGLAFRWGGGPMFHLTPHISFAAEVSHQIGFQDRNDVDMKTSFFSVLTGIRLRL